ncbi:MAG: acylphosphatase [archaeon]|jgi:acylphosphatase
MVEVTLLVNFFGRVQGVGFRFLCLRKANSLGLTGWVRNAPKFDLVETCLQGEKKKVDELIAYFKENPFNIHIEKVVIEEVSGAEKLNDFQVKY